MRSLFALLLAMCSLPAQGREYYLIAGTYTKTGKKHSGSAGIYVYRFNDSTGTLQWVSNTALGTVTNPSYLVVRPDGKYIYACTDTRTAKEGSVSAFAFNDSSGTIRFINSQPSGGANPVYLALHKNGKWLLNANYTAGSISAYPVSDEGSIMPARQLIQQYGSGPITDRQDKAHVHATVFSPDDKYLFVPDLGADKIMAYAFNEHADMPLQPAHIPFVAAEPGSGPRHLVFHPGGSYAYCIEELSGIIAVYNYHNGVLVASQRLRSYRNVQAHFNSADIHLSPDGRFLYASNRGLEHNIAIFSIDPANGHLILQGHTDTEGIEPRNFIITPSGNYLLVANQLSGTIVVFARNRQTGLLTPAGNIVHLPEPSCLQLLSAR